MTAPAGQIQSVPVDSVSIHPEIADSVIPLSDIKYSELVTSIERDGQLVAIDIALIDGKLTVIEGHHRLEVNRGLGLPTIDCRFRPEITTVAEAILFTSASNLHRRQLTAKEDRALGRRVAALRAEGLSIRRIAEEIGTSKSTIERALAQVSQPETPEVATVIGKDKKRYKARRGKGSEPLGPVGQLIATDARTTAVNVCPEDLTDAHAEGERARGWLSEYLGHLTYRIEMGEGVEYPLRGKTEYKRRPSTDPVAETVTTAVGKLVKDSNGKAIPIVPEPRVGKAPATMTASEYVAKYPGTTVRELRQIGREHGVLRSLHDTKLDFIAKLDAAGIRFPAVLGLGGAS
jgi:hypothetical protein